MSHPPTDAPNEPMTPSGSTPARYRGGRSRGRSGRNWLVTTLLLGFAYLTTGWSIVPTDQQLLVLRCGRVLFPLRQGLTWDLPWPFTQRYPLRLQSTVVLSSNEDGPASPLLLDPAPRRQRAPFLTGDQNLLAGQLQLRYRIDPADPAAHLLVSRDLGKQLLLLAEAAAAELLLASPVDQAMASGLVELQQELTQRVALAATAQRLGVIVEAVVLEQLEPPARVQADFRDVASARADQSRIVAEAQAEAALVRARAGAEADARKQRAETAARQLSERTLQQVERLSLLRSALPTAASERMAVMERWLRQLLADRLAAIGERQIVPADQPLDVTIWDGRPRDASSPGLLLPVRPTPPAEQP